MNNGWVKLHRRIMGSSVWNNPRLLKVWIWCLLKASHKSHTVLVGNTPVELLPGQFIFGRNEAAEELKINPSTLYKDMQLLKKMKNLDIKSNNKFSVVSVENWGLYQSMDDEVEQVKEQQRNNNVTTKEQQRNTNKNVKNEKNDNNDSYSLNTRCEVKEESEPVDNFAPWNKRVKLTEADSTAHLNQHQAFIEANRREKNEWGKMSVEERRAIIKKRSDEVLAEIEKGDWK